jgi:hypothetical protein
MKIIELSERPVLLKEAVQNFWTCWGNETNFIFYEDCIIHALKPENSLPKFYVLLEENKIIGSYALLTNDIISRQDLMPWFACLFVNEDKRNIGLGELLLTHGPKEANLKGFSMLYLSTDLEGFYEKKGWILFGDGCGVSGGYNKIYAKQTTQ